ncbi:ABC-type branched-subunit amino acid transport system substrate-binding protein [Amycolatopsis bartoniae]|uniref:Leucine-binding protein domain-containing protein n=1 Tax=Amycolatopsis bartoniae TaxID=941986 RepID=A0A8H9ISC2_9PSEU|nr:ABC transporter substrate-binding protein [Amycolatopsis bartoniae]MBB2939946.1 ABC-type branched-subunit amino acid transport system substrate-binding protein [Amycolatopsis bartoniae]TVT10124.1 ABC transporter substrate-binding protein [Amycolatopsis bartoniae]GHF35549.1 hypothetical protein GCM10017566_05500 [Amycolatopsis bartoniae]
MATKDGMPVDPPELRPFDLHPYRIGVINDFPGIAGDLADDWVRAMELAFDEAYASRRISRSVEIVRKELYGHPYQSAYSGQAVYRELVEKEHVLGVIGPMKTDDSLAVQSEVEKLHVPYISMCGSEHVGGPEVFVCQQGNLPDEPPVALDWLAAKGITTVALVAENNAIGYEYMDYFLDNAPQRGVEVVALSTSIAQADDLDHIAAEFERLKRSGAQCLAYWGLGHNNTKLNPALEKAGWEPEVKVMSSAFVTAAMGERWARALDGWAGLDQFDERNPHYQSLLDRYEKRYGKRPNNAMFPCGYDMARVMVEALARLKYMAPSAVTKGIERVRRLPAAAGAPGTYISFGPWERRGYRGEYLVVRRAENGKSILDETWVEKVHNRT